jgi:hypothetical protein
MFDDLFETMPLGIRRNSRFYLPEFTGSVLWLLFGLSVQLETLNTLDQCGRQQEMGGTGSGLESRRREGFSNRRASKG